MINSGVFDYVNVLDKAADASWLRNEVIANNIANVDTPGFKRSDVDFESTLARELGYVRSSDMDNKVANLKTSRLKAESYVDYGNYSYRSDGNNVDIENENVLLAQNQLKYQGLMNAIGAEFDNLKAVIK